MVSKTHGVASASQVLTKSLEYYTVWTGDITDQTQKNFELIIQSIGLRAMPIVLNNPLAVADLAADGASAVTGEGFVWVFSVETEGAFATKSDPVGLLVEEMDGIVLLNGAVIRTSGVSQNVEFEWRDTL
jgi:hypothetical protein